MFFCMEMNEATRAAVKKMQDAAHRAEREGHAQRAAGNCERAERCEGRAHAFDAAVGMLVVEHEKR